MDIDVSTLTSHFPNPQDGFTATTSGSVSSGAATVGLSSTGNYDNGDIVVLIIDPADSDKKQVLVGTIDVSGSQVTGVKWVGGTNQTHNSGATVVDYYDAAHIKMMTKGLLVSLNQDGTLRNGAVHSTSVLSSNTVDSDAIVDGSIDGEHLSTNAITLGYAQITSSFASASTSDADVTGLSVAVTVPTGGRRVKISVFVPYIQAGGGGTATEIAIKEGATTLSRVRANNPASATNPINNPVYSAAVSSGAHTYKVTLKNDSAVSATIGADATFPAFILVEAI
jgi:hypothetical protein